MEIVRLKCSQLLVNEGQVEGLPTNPRSWTKADIDRLARSLEETPELFEARPCIVYPYGDKYIVLGGNMRLTAAKTLKYKDVPCIVIPAETTIDKLKEIVMKDNGSFGSWDYDELANCWDDMPLTDWAVPAWNSKVAERDEDEDDLELSENKLDDKRRYALTLEFKTLELKNEWIELAEECGVKIKKGLNWGRGDEHRCDMTVREKVYKKGQFYYTSSFHSTTKGEPLSMVKTPQNVPAFTEAAISIIRNKIEGIERSRVRLVGAPARKHKVGNFTEMVCNSISAALGITYDSRLIQMKNADRFHPDFYLRDTISEEVVILYDDIITTGKTLTEMYRLFDGKEIIVVVGITNEKPFKVLRQ